jgi:hypothetical protein
MLLIMTFFTSCKKESTEKFNNVRLEKSQSLSGTKGSTEDINIQLFRTKTIEQPETSKDFLFKDFKVQLIKTDGLWKGVVHMKTTSSGLREYDIELYFRNNDGKVYHYFWPVNVLPGEQMVNTTFSYQIKEFPNFPKTVECFEISNEEPPN